MVSPRLEGAGVRRGDRWILRRATLALAPGEITALVGPNGAGKTTLLRALAGLVGLDEGRAALGDRELASIGRRELARQVAYVPQRATPPSAVTVADLVSAGRYPHRGPLGRLGRDDEAAIERALERADVGELAQRRVTTLSGGELQRVLLARGLASGAATLLLDEPTASLDLAHSIDLLELCRSLAREGVAVALAIHDLGVALRIADRLALLHAGELIATGDPASVLDAARLDAVFGLRAIPLDGPDGARHWAFERR